MLKHETVLKNEAIEYLNVQPNGIYVDGTLGGGGHAYQIVSRLDQGFLYAFDQDEYAISRAQDVLKVFDRYRIIHSNFRNIKEELAKQNVHQIDGLLLDLGLSSFQIDDEDRGFTYLKDTDLDMRMDRTQSMTAKTVLNTYSMEELARIFFLYGEEKNGFKLARRIVEKRPLETTMDLVKITDQVNRNEKGHSAKRAFQALRIAVNDELSALETVLRDAVKLLKPNGRLVVITFHSLEDRIVKHFFKEMSSAEDLKGLPVALSRETDFDVLTKKPVYPSEEEMMINPRSRSAKLRALRRR